ARILADFVISSRFGPVHTSARHIVTVCCAFSPGISCGRKFINKHFSHHHFIGCPLPNQVDVSTGYFQVAFKSSDFCSPQKHVGEAQIAVVIGTDSGPPSGGCRKGSFFLAVEDRFRSRLIGASEWLVPYPASSRIDAPISVRDSPPTYRPIQAGINLVIEWDKFIC